MMFVFDTNVLMSISFTKRGTMGTLRKLWREKKLSVASSEAIVAEVERVLGYPEIQAIHHWSAARQRVYLSNLRRKIERYPGVAHVTIEVGDESDKKFLSCGDEAQAAAIVSGDEHLLNLHRYKGIPILTPAQCMRRFFLEEDRV